jgi:hypothetical protein
VERWAGLSIRRELSVPGAVLTGFEPFSTTGRISCSSPLRQHAFPPARPRQRRTRPRIQHRISRWRWADGAGGVFCLIVLPVPRFWWPPAEREGSFDCVQECSKRAAQPPQTRTTLSQSIAPTGSRPARTFGWGMCTSANQCSSRRCAGTGGQEGIYVDTEQLGRERDGERVCVARAGGQRRMQGSR